jgi:hypothetical protein
VHEAYVVRIVRQNELVRLNERYADFLQVGFFAFGRFDGTLQNAAAVRVMQTTRDRLTRGHLHITTRSTSSTERDRHG